MRPSLGWLLTSVDHWGINIWRRGDEITWLWPWERDASGRPWSSPTAHGAFASLAEIDKFWEDYADACAEIMEREDRKKLRALFLPGSP